MRILYASAISTIVVVAIGLTGFVIAFYDALRKSFFDLLLAVLPYVVIGAIISIFLLVLVVLWLFIAGRLSRSKVK